MKNNGGEMWSKWWDGQEKMFSFWEGLYRQPGRMTELFAGQGRDVWQNYRKAQEKMAEFWMESISGIFNPTKETSSELTDRFIKYFKEGLDAINGYIVANIKMAWQDMSKETGNMLKHSSEIAEKLFSMWSELADRANQINTREKWEAYMDIWADNYKKTLAHLEALDFPGPVGVSLKMWGELADMFHKGIKGNVAQLTDSMSGFRGVANEIIKSCHQECKKYLQALQHAVAEGPEAGEAKPAC